MLIEGLIRSTVLSVIILVPLGIKWELEKKIVIPAAFLIGIISWMVVKGVTFYVHLSFYQILPLDILLIAMMSISLLLWRFFRDPERIPPDIEKAILSPADGRIIYVKTIQNGEVPFLEKNGRKFALTDFVQADIFPLGVQIVSIAMNFLDVHVNRAPIGGKICLLKRIKGLFISLKKKEAIIQNERVFTVIENKYLKVGIVQIASRIVRKIVPYLKEGNEVRCGQRIGMIRFGSQVDLILPNMPSLNIEVSPGEKVKAGLSVVATFDVTQYTSPALPSEFTIETKCSE
jgi:phosphatidylserine decarboxylase